MSFDSKYSAIPMVSDNIGMPDLPIILPNGVQVIICMMGSNADRSWQRYKGGKTIYTPAASPPAFSFIPNVDLIQWGVRIDGANFWTLPFKVEPAVYDKSPWCVINAYDSVKYNYPSYPIRVYFKATTRKIEQQNVVVKYDDEVGTIIPLSQKQYDVLTFTTHPMNSDYARLLLDISEWDNVTFAAWSKSDDAWTLPYKVAKKAEAWNKTTYPKTLGTTIQGSFVIKQ